MSGHSKWKNIMHKKEKTDAQRAKVFTKIGKEMSIAVKEGGSNPTSNSRLKDLIAKAKSMNVPNDNIERIIKKASTDDSAKYENITYEGYGPNGVAVIVECATDNRNRTGGDIRHYFDKFGGNLGATGCVTYLFSQKGVIVIEAAGIDEDKLMDDVLEAGAADFVQEDEVFQVFTDPTLVSEVSGKLEKCGYNFMSAEAEMIPSMYVRLDDEESVAKMNKLLEHLEDHDDVINIWHNWENGDE
ncbi:MAG: YebC/PmpR family DNA-binding transcriptional regulator [Oscillospiraceae bacterium]|nr:YebC/PmpR family DNA-binding transcriptional regulator [Oscillospiraceae bacterium]